MNRDFIQKLTYDTNNGGILELIQRGHDGTVLIAGTSSHLSKTEFIPNGDMVITSLQLFTKIKNTNPSFHSII